jgi:GDSL-like Lipase/Acylhydrolase family/Chaperone of endosialidase/Bacterial surface protein, Ig-like domain
MKRPSLRAHFAILVIAFAVSFAPYARLAEAATTSQLFNPDPFADTANLWGALIASAESAAHAVASLLTPPHPQRLTGTHTTHIARKQLPAAAALSQASSVESFNVKSTTSKGATDGSPPQTKAKSRSPPLASATNDLSPSALVAPSASVFVTHDELDQSLSVLGTSLRQLIVQSASVPPIVSGPGAPLSVEAFAPSQAIDNLNNTTITSPTISGGSISGTSVSASSLSDSGDASISGNLNVSGSVTGGSVALSAASTSAIVATNATSTNFFATNASTTNATSTNLFASFAHAATGMVDTLSSTAATITNLIATTINATNLTAVNATTTNATSATLAVTGTASTSALVVSGTQTNSAIAANALLYNNASRQLAAVDIGDSLSFAAGTLSLNTGNANTWTGLQQFANASSSLFSVYGPAYFGATATSSFASTGALTLAIPLLVSSGGTGWANIAPGAIPFGNGASPLATSSSLYWDNTNKRLGIGTTSPTAIITIDSNSPIGTLLRVSNASAGGHIYDLLSTGSGNTGGAGRFDLYDFTVGAPRLSITSSGNVGIGTTSPFAMFAVNGPSAASTFNAYAANATSTFSGGVNFSGYVSGLTATEIGGLSYATTSDFISTYSIAAWGDSLTSGGVNLPEVSYPSQLSALTGYYVYNGGVSGEQSQNIRARMIAATDKYSWPTIIWAGRNNYSNASQVESDIATMVAALTTSHYLILSIPNSSAEPTGTSNYNQIIALNNYLASTYGSHYLDVRSYLVSQYDPTQPQDVTDHSNDVPPTSLRADSLHFNEAGYQKVAQLIQQNIGILIPQSNTPPLLDTQNLQYIFQHPAAFSTINVGDTGYKQDDQLLLTASTSNYSTLLGFLTGRQLTSSGLYNTGLGYETLTSVTSGVSNTAAGFQALNFTTSSNSTGVGDRALTNDTSGGSNTSIGSLSLFSNTTGSDNLAIGDHALFTATSSGSNIALGFQAGYNVTTGGNNILIGVDGGRTSNLTTGSSNIVIGNNLNLPSGTASNQLDIQNIIYGTGNSGSGSSLSAGNVGIGTTTPGSIFSIGNATGINFSTATSTFSTTGGINLTSGCFAVAGSCINISSGASLSAANTWTALQQFSAGASSTQESVVTKAYFGGTATSTFDSAGNLTLANLASAVLGVNSSGQVVATSTIGSNLITVPANSLLAGNSSGQIIASTTIGTNLLTGVLGVANGGTGTTTWQSGSIPFFNGVRLTENNTNLFWDNGNKRLGVGTTSPQGVVDLAGSSNSNSITSFLGASTLSIINTDPTNSNNESLAFRTNDANGLLSTAAKITAINTSHSANAISSDLAILNVNAGSISETARFTAGGNFGISTTSPWGRLGVVNGSANGPAISVSNGFNTAGINISETGNTGNSISLTDTTFVPAISVSKTTSAVTSNNDSSGLLVTGTYAHNPSSNSSGGLGRGVHITVSNNTGSTGSLIGADVSATANTTGATAIGLNVSANSSSGTAYSGIFSGGNFGIGTTSPWRTLSVNGTVGLAGLSSVSTNQSAYLCLSSNNEVVQDSTTCLASSLRFKQNIQSLSASTSLSEILALNPVSFQYTPQYNGALQTDPNFNGTFVGFIAEDVAKVDPRLITVDATGSTPNAPHGVRYENITAILTGGIQEIASISGEFEKNLIGWLGNASNGIGDLFANNIHAQNELCVGSTCVTQAQFQAMVAAAGQSSSAVSETTEATSASTSSSGGTNTPPVIQINGDNPAIIQVGDTYNDLGATITGPQADLNLGIATFVNGTASNPVQIDTTQVATDTVDYVVTGQSGLTSTTTRTVIIQSAFTSSVASSTAGTSTSTQTTSATTAGQ